MKMIYAPITFVNEALAVTNDKRNLTSTLMNTIDHQNLQNNQEEQR